MTLVASERYFQEVTTNDNLCCWQILLSYFSFRVCSSEKANVAVHIILRLSRRQVAMIILPTRVSTHARRVTFRNQVTCAESECCFIPC